MHVALVHVGSNHLASRRVDQFLQQTIATHVPSSGAIAFRQREAKIGWAVLTLTMVEVTNGRSGRSRTIVNRTSHRLKLNGTLGFLVTVPIQPDSILLRMRSHWKTGTYCSMMAHFFMGQVYLTVHGFFENFDVSIET